MQGWELAVKQYNFYWGICIVWMQQILGTVTFTISHHFTYSEGILLSEKTKQKNLPGKAAFKVEIKWNKVFLEMMSQRMEQFENPLIILEPSSSSEDQETFLI